MEEERPSKDALEAILDLVEPENFRKPGESKREIGMRLLGEYIKKHKKGLKVLKIKDDDYLADVLRNLYHECGPLD